MGRSWRLKVRVPIEMGIMVWRKKCENAFRWCPLCFDDLFLLGILEEVGEFYSSIVGRTFTERDYGSSIQKGFKRYIQELLRIDA
ncbi:hypothetical protein CEXT_77251 [Caerostris extrusa]|uniref:Uncharacterized protein n=1 Tax=Caerostris extrusa TaxID=172846 RepID=A0AAV4P4Z6_CAEEX|nr:hypothetical protein CEXT_77251 [Caerostris extrusa]